MKTFLKPWIFTLLTVGIVVSAVALEATAQQKRGQRGERGERGNRDGNGSSLTVGEIAPTFVLKSLDGDSETDLSEFQGKRPVVLFFGSYT